MVSIKDVGASVFVSWSLDKHPLHVTCEEISVIPQLSTKLWKYKWREKLFKKIHQIIWIGPDHLDVMGIWNIVQGRPGKCLFYLTFCVSYMNTISLFLTWCNFLQTDCMGSECFVLLVRMPLDGGRPFGDQSIGTRLSLISSKYHVLIWVMKFDELLSLLY